MMEAGQRYHAWPRLGFGRTDRRGLSLPPTDRTLGRIHVREAVATAIIATTQGNNLARPIPDIAFMVSSWQPVPWSSQVIPTSSQVTPTSSQVMPTSSQVMPTSSQVTPTSSQLMPGSSKVVLTSTQVTPTLTYVAPTST